MKSKMRSRLAELPQSIDMQILAMRQQFPQFWYLPTIRSWIGTLTPRKNKPITYLIKVMYPFGEYPQVRVLSPDIRHDAPHTYRDMTLCLYRPADESWTSAKLIANTIVPWTAEWLRYYEIWLNTGFWCGPEAPHIVK
ncbi:MAG: hypothetical protein U0528_06065 [Anaerolineae bacterium]